MKNEIQLPQREAARPDHQEPYKPLAALPVEIFVRDERRDFDVCS
jgi:hypothetical protein